MKKVLITGGGGFIGFHLAQYLNLSNDDITIIDNFSRNKVDAEFESFIKNKNVRLIQSDMTKTDFHNELSNHYDEIYHFAAINGTKYFYEKPYEVLRVNILSLINILEWINESNTGKFLLASSSETYAGTINKFGSQVALVPTKEDISLCISDVFNERFSYGGSKIACELLVVNFFKKIKTNFTIVRYHNVYGPRMGYEHVIPEFCKRIYLKEKPFNVNGGEETRAFCFISDAVEATVMAMRTQNTNREILNIGNPYEEIKMVDLARLIIELNNINTEIKVNNAPEGSVKRRCPDINKLIKMTGYSPKINLKEGLRLTSNWYFNAFNQA